LTRRDSCFSVCSPQGVENWQTAADPLISNGLLFSSTVSERKGSGKQKSREYAVALEGRNTLNRPVPPMAIQRLYQPAASALDDLVEALYHLLADTGDEPQDSSATSEPNGHLLSGRPRVRNVS
jgi:hypothetical protein